MTILIAEDDTLILRTVELVLKKEGYTIISAKDGLEAVEKIEQHKPDLIVTDIMLPYFSGLELLGKVKQSERPVPVIVTSSMAQAAVATEAKKLGADAFFTKPYNIDELITLIPYLSGSVTYS